MLLPNKLYSYSESVISKFPVALKELQKHPMSVTALYEKMRSEVTGITEFVELLDCLYALQRIQYDESEGVLKYVVRN